MTLLLMFVSFVVGVVAGGFFVARGLETLKAQWATDLELMRNRLGMLTAVIQGLIDEQEAEANARR